MKHVSLRTIPYGKGLLVKKTKYPRLDSRGSKSIIQRSTPKLKKPKNIFPYQYHYCPAHWAVENWKSCMETPTVRFHWMSLPNLGFFFRVNK